MTQFRVTETGGTNSLNCLSASASLSTIAKINRTFTDNLSQLPFGFCLTFDFGRRCRRLVVHEVVSQLPFGFCLTFDLQCRLQQLPVLMAVSIAFRLLSHFRRPRNMRTSVPSTSLVSIAFRLLSHFRPAQEALDATVAGAGGCLNCLSAFVSLSTVIAMEQIFSITRGSQLPFGFCLTFDFREDENKDPTRPTRLNCLSAFVSLSTITT